jgi:biopolymer transport protein ExbB/TolQ
LDKQAAIADEKNRKQRIVIWSVIGGLLLVAMFAIFILRALRITNKQKVIIEKQKQKVDIAYTELDIKNKEIEEQKKIVEEHHKETMDSIRYASRIQRALITSEKYIDKTLNRMMKNS